jgi:hypothetical protein
MVGFNQSGQEVVFQINTIDVEDLKIEICRLAKKTKSAISRRDYTKAEEYLSEILKKVE